jgi:D-hexose-6-phosphate mutarotase
LKDYYSYLPSEQRLLHIENKYSKAILAPQGAHLISWLPVDTCEILYLSPKAKFENGVAIRGGIPICWPWFGNNRENLPAHGYARTSSFEVLNISHQDENTIVTLVSPNFDHIFVKVTIFLGNVLTIRLETSNTSETTFEFTQALHSYFNIGDINLITIQGLENTTYFDKVRNTQDKINDKEFKIKSETDIIVHQPKDIIIKDPSLKRDIMISSHFGQDAVIWNPWINKAAAISDLPDEDYKKFCCVESSNISLPIKLSPGESFILDQQIGYVLH